jgi:hypothetical protein
MPKALSPAVPAEFMGQARLLIQGVQREEIVLMRILTRINLTLNQRLRHKPTVRPETCIELERHRPPHPRASRPHLS